MIFQQMEMLEKGCSWCFLMVTVLLEFQGAKLKMQFISIGLGNLLEKTVKYSKV